MKVASDEYLNTENVGSNGYVEIRCQELVAKDLHGKINVLASSWPIMPSGLSLNLMDSSVKVAAQGDVTYQARGNVRYISFGDYPVLHGHKVEHPHGSFLMPPPPSSQNGDASSGVAPTSIISKWRCKLRCSSHACMHARLTSGVTSSSSSSGLAGTSSVKTEESDGEAAAIESFRIVRGEFDDVDFVSDVLEFSEKYQKRFGPLRYFVTGFLKFFLCLPKYSYEVEYLPVLKDEREGNLSVEREVVDMSDLYTDIMRRSNTDGILEHPVFQVLIQL